ncbi:hypothetical protein AB6A40_011716, partial [Gnathostoma spinigerum]
TLAEVQSQLGHYKEALSAIDSLWMVYMKNAPDPKFGFGKELLKDCEIATILLLLNTKVLKYCTYIAYLHK